MKTKTATAPKWIRFILFVLLVYAVPLQGQQSSYPVRQQVCIEWSNGKPNGTIELQNGHLAKIKITIGKGKVRGNRFEFSSTGRARIAIEIDSARIQPGPGPTLISVKTTTAPFSFLLRDVTEQFPIYIPDYSVVVLSSSDMRSYAEVQVDILSRKLQTKAQKIESEPEESFASAGERTMNQSVPTWLGISRDFRIFQISESMPDMPDRENYITPKFSSSPLRLPGISERGIVYAYNMGRGINSEVMTTRRLEEGILPILHSTHTDDDIEYHSTYFVSLEHSSLNARSVTGTHFLVADKHCSGDMFTDEQEEIYKLKRKDAFNTGEETVLYFRSEMTNRGQAPRYAWFQTITLGRKYRQHSPYPLDPHTGFSAYAPDSVYCISKLNGKPLHNEEMAVLLQPGEKAVFEFFLPHSPISNERARALSTQSFDERFRECKAFWQTKLKGAAQIRVPEKRIEEMIQAGLLHLDLITYGNEPDGTLAPTIGHYSPIGTESSPIMQFYASMGWNDIAKRSLTYFLDKQHEDGFIQNFGGYMVETGAALWSMGEYFRYTHDTEWVKEVEPKLLKSCDYLLEWRERNKREELRGRGYGMIDGKVADPEDPFHSYMLNGYGYLGLKRVAEILVNVDPGQSERLQKEAEAWRNDIRESFFNAMALSPVVPMGDGSWSPTSPPWPEAAGLRELYVSRETLYSHGTLTLDALLGPLYLVFCEVLDTDEQASRILLDYHQELFYQNNVAFSQPYYSRHNWVQARLGMVKPFLKTYYNTFAGLADRETYTFWEHYSKVSVHKTHEEAWFLMQTRWMLYMEDGETLKLLSMIPRKWLEDGKSIELNGVQSYFGSLNVKVKSAVGKGYMEASIQCDPEKKPDTVTIRLPHPEGEKAVKVTGGTYDPDTETVTVRSFDGNARIKAEF
ncbi:MAG: hypothetical protein ABFS38_04050 [Bacteroidota bacterium]